MTALRALLVLTALALTPAGAQAQTWQPRPGAPAVDPHRYQADQHRLEMDRIRAQADQREALARQMEIETRLSRQRIEAARLPEPVQPPAPRGGTGISRYKITPLFFVRAANVSIECGVAAFELRAVQQLRQTISAHMFFQELSAQTVKEYYFGGV